MSSEKRKLIEEMLKMQQEFIDFEQTHGVDPVELWAGQAEHPLHGYKDKYAEMANKVLELAHEEQDSKR